MTTQQPVFESVRGAGRVVCWWLFAVVVALGAARARAGGAPVDWLLSRTEYRAGIRGDELDLGVRLTLWVFNTSRVESIPLLPASIAWEDVAVNGRRGVLRKAREWLCLDFADGERRGPVRVTVAARTVLRALPKAGVRRASVAARPSSLTVLKVHSTGAWEVRASRAPLYIVGDDRKGTRGELALARGAGEGDTALAMSWLRPRPMAVRRGWCTYRSAVSWHLDDGLQEVRARFDIRVVGGERQRLDIRLPAMADRVKVTGPDVRRWDRNGDAATVHLKGKIRGATRVFVECAVPWRAGKGKARLARFGIEDRQPEAGVLVITSGVNAVVLEEKVRGLEAIGLWDIPENARSLTASAPVSAYAFTGGRWEIGIDVVSLAEMSVRETLIDEAKTAVLLRPDGSTMHKVNLRVRNRTRQFLRVRLPGRACRIVRVRVSERPVRVSRAPGGAVLIPLTRSVETLGGAVSFPIEILFLDRIAPLARRGRLDLALMRADVPAARSECTLFVPRGFKAKKWEGAFRVAEELDSVVGRMGYGYGHVARETVMAEEYYRAALRAYGRGEYTRAEEAAKKAVQSDARFEQAADANKLLSNIDILKGTKAARARSEKLFAGQLLRQEAARQSETHARQRQLVRKGWRYVQEGRESAATAAFKAAEQVGQVQTATEQGRRRERAVLRESRQWLERHEAAARKNAELRRQAEDLRRSLRRPRGEALRAAVEVIRRRGTEPAEESGLDEADASNVAASGRIAVQQVAGKGERRTGAVMSLEARNAILERQLAELKKEPARGLRDSLRGDTLEKDAGRETMQSVLRAVRKMADEKRYAEAGEALEKAKSLGGEGKTSEAVEALAREVRERRTKEGGNAFNVRDLAATEGEGRALAEFLGRNYDAPTGRGPAPAGVVYRDGQILTSAGADADKVIARALDNLRKNLRQKVAVNTRELGVDERTVAEMGASWHEMAGGRWAVVDEGQLNTLLTLEQRSQGPAMAFARSQREIVPGTAARLSNDALVTLHLAEDAYNTMRVNEATVKLPHAGILLVSSRGRIVAARAGATQYWMDQPKAPAIEEVPMEIAMPVVGMPVRFEKVLVQPEDALRIECRYTYKEVDDG